MKIVKVNDNLLINIEQIYSLEKTNNNADIQSWEDLYNQTLNEYYKNPPELMLDGGIYFKPVFEKENDQKHLQEYIKKLNDLIINDIGPKPYFYETYKVILSTGLQITIDKNIYDHIEKYLLKYVLK